MAVKCVITLSDPNLPFYAHCSHKRKLFRPGHGRHGIIVIFSNPCQLHLIYWLLQGFHELRNANTLYMALEIGSESKWEFSVCQKKSCHQDFLFAHLQILSHQVTLQLTSNKGKLSFVFFFWMNVFQINNYHWTHINNNGWKESGSWRIQAKGLGGLYKIPFETFGCFFKIIYETFGWFVQNPLWKLVAEISVTGPCWYTFAPG